MVSLICEIYFKNKERNKQKDLKNRDEISWEENESALCLGGRLCLCLSGFFFFNYTNILEKIVWDNSFYKMCRNIMENYFPIQRTDETNRKQQDGRF